MFRERFGARWLATLVVLVSAVSGASAGWLTLRNDSPRGIIVQEVTKAPDGSAKRGRPTRLLSGETLANSTPGPMTKWLEVYDMQAPATPLFSGRVAWQNDNQIFSISSNGKAATVTPAVPKITLPGNTSVASPKKT